MPKKTKVKASVDVEKLDTIRAQLPATTTTGYFNAGTNGPIPALAFDAMTAAARDELDAGRIRPGLWEASHELLSSTRGTIASMIGAQPSEIALMRSTTEGMNVALMGMEWRRGDEVITTQLEHVCRFSVLGLLSHRHGGTIRTVDIGSGGGDVAEAIR